MPGLYHGVTTGGPITLRLVNNDAKLERLAEPAAPRGGHIDLAGAINYQTGIRQVLERASARETAMRVAVGGAGQALARASSGSACSATCVELGGIAAPPLSLDLKVRDASPVYTLNPEADAAIVAAIDAAQEAGDTLGGIVETIVTGCPIGLGSHAQWDRKLDARLAAAVMSVQAIKGVEIGLGVEAARQAGVEGDGPDPLRARPSRRRPPLRLPPADQQRRRNRRGNVQRRADHRPSRQEADQHPGRARTLGEHGDQGPAPASYERSDVCAVPAASVIVENVVAFEIAAAIVEKYVGTSLEAIKAAMAAMHELNRERLERWDGDTESPPRPTESLPSN